LKPRLSFEDQDFIFRPQGAPRPRQGLHHCEECSKSS